MLKAPHGGTSEEREWRRIAKFLEAEGDTWARRETYLPSSRRGEEFSK